MAIPDILDFNRFCEAPTDVLDLIRDGQRVAINRRKGGHEPLFHVVGAKEVPVELDVWTPTRIRLYRRDFKRKACAHKPLALSTGGMVCAVTEGVK